MTTSRIFFGASAILFGVIALLWHDVETWQTLHQLFKLPLGVVIALGLMTLQIGGGLGILIPRAARPSAVVLCFVYICFLLACAPAVIKAPAAYGSYPTIQHESLPGVNIVPGQRCSQVVQFKERAAGHPENGDTTGFEDTSPVKSWRHNSKMGDTMNGSMRVSQYLSGDIFHKRTSGQTRAHNVRTRASRRRPDIH